MQLLPLLEEINRKIDEVARKLDAMAARQAEGLARLEQYTGRNEARHDHR